MDWKIKALTSSELLASSPMKFRSREVIDKVEGFGGCSKRRSALNSEAGARGEEDSPEVCVAVGDTAG